MSYDDTEPRVYVGTYRKYNNGNLFGKWLNLDDYDDEDEFREACLELHKDEDDPEIMFQDFEGFPEGFYNESHIDVRFWDWNKLDDHEKEVYEAYVRCVGDDGTEVSDVIGKHYGTWPRKADYAEEFCNGCYPEIEELPSFISCHIDWEGVARDLFMDLDYDEPTGMVFDRNR